MSLQCVHASPSVRTPFQLLTAVYGLTPCVYVSVAVCVCISLTHGVSAGDVCLRVDRWSTNAGDVCLRVDGWSTSVCPAATNSSKIVEDGRRVTGTHTSCSSARHSDFLAPHLLCTGSCACTVCVWCKSGPVCVCGRVAFILLEMCCCCCREYRGGGCRVQLRRAPLD